MMIVVARYGLMRSVGVFRCNDVRLQRWERCVLRTPRGTEVGWVLMVKDAEERGGKVDGEVLRKMNEEDELLYERITREYEPEELESCNREIQALHLPMRLIEVEHLFGGEKIIFYFSAEGRVDFRELVKRLARKYKTRIEMRQIGVRDEARLLADFEVCGMEICCRSFLKDFSSVSMKQAKLQRLPLDPSKISGRCGRLKCCLNYETETYRELIKCLPARGSRVSTPEGNGEVVDVDVLGGRVVVELKDGRVARFEKDTVTVLEE